MIYKALLFSLIAFPYLINAQIKKIDSLQVVLKKTKNDTVKCNILYQIADISDEDQSASTMNAWDSCINLGLKKHKEGTIEYKYFVRQKAEFLNTTGCNLIAVGNASEALSLYEQSLELSLKYNYRKIVASNLSNIAMAHHNLGNNKKALDYNNQSIKIREEIGDKDGLGYSYGNISTLYQDMGEYETAIYYGEKGLKIREELGDLKNIASSLNNMGTIYDDLGDPEKAMKYYDRCIKIKEEINDKYTLSITYLNIGSFYKHQGNNAKALEFYEKSKAMATKLNNKDDLAAVLNNIGVLYDDIGLSLKAIDYYEKSIKNSEEIGHKKNLAITLGNIGIIYRERKEYDKALEYYDRALSIYKELGDKRRVAVIYNNKGIVFKIKGDYEKAIEKFNESAEIRESLGDKQGLAGSKMNLAAIYVIKKQYRKALNLALQSLAIRRELNYSNEIKLSCLWVGMSYKYLNKLDSAEAYWKEALMFDKRAISNNFGLLSEMEKEGFINTISGDYSEFSSYALLRKEKNQAITELVYNNTLQNKGLLLKSSTAMRLSILRSGDSTLRNTYTRWLNIKKQAAKIYAQGKDTKEIDEQANELEKFLVKKSEAFSDMEKTLGADWKSVQKLLSKDDAAVEFIHFKHQGLSDTVSQVIYCALVIRPDSKSPEMIRLFKESELKGLMGNEETGYDYINQLYGTKLKPNKKLYSLIWKPIEKSLAGAKNVYYSPSGLLHKISFASISTDSKKYLCDNYNLQFRSSTAKINTKTALDATQNTNVTVFGGIQYDTPLSLKDTSALISWPYLEGTRKEADKITEIFKKEGVNLKYLSGSEATEEKFRETATQSEMLHIATHGFFFTGPQELLFDEEQEVKSRHTKILRGGTNAIGIFNFYLNKNPYMRSGLAMAGANEVWSRDTVSNTEDGVLTAQEALSLDLSRTKLLVLSACETGLGDIKGAEGVYGLQRAFKMAGVKCIIMSLWQVPDEETVEFMNLFYTELFRVKDINQAFYFAQENMRKKYDAFFWAPFVLME